MRNMLIAEYDYDTDIKVKQQEAFEDGISQGIEQGVAQQKAKDEKLLKQTVAQITSQKDAEVARQAKEISELKAQLAKALGK